MISCLDHVQIAAPRGCEEAARKFYGELLGLTEVAKPEELAKRGGVWFQVGAQQLHIGVEEDFRPAKKAHPAFGTENLDAVAGQLEQHGCEIVWDEAIPGLRRFYVSDPWGNRLEILELKR